ncbi:hypothetical protein QO004_003660 [Rhizobium mesoamericanum]|nr:hypothetical protein [Rhizobium mesoamericanum]
MACGRDKFSRATTHSNARLMKLSRVPHDWRSPTAMRMPPACKAAGRDEVALASVLGAELVEVGGCISLSG